MRKLGMIGGMSWVSTRLYYETINRLVQRRATPMASAPLLIESLDFCQLYGLKEEADWDRAGKVLVESAKRLEAAGAEGLIIAANSMHRQYNQVAEAVEIPVLHIAECVGERMAKDKVGQAAIIGTKNVMTESFYRRRLVSHGIDLVPPDMERVEETNRIIYEELMKGQATRDAERFFKTAFTRLEQDGVTALVLACTELNLVVDANANVLPIYDSARIHCEAAVDWILDD
ncbi:aspartate/glutamate racemase family protein [Parerythrobacter jejuensis]|uniref:Amino acid racemase n=1 Tax=Parerythrobacter jejuensis TaxID=795812 RepID=A0A845AQL8_9SPHN|nr:amino acid racemase [Parerythrobacter jejuensis]MXP31759.1 amino acid racemase [Parerythrobacter jejuensis]